MEHTTPEWVSLGGLPTMALLQLPFLVAPAPFHPPAAFASDTTPTIDELLARERQRVTSPIVDGVFGGPARLATLLQNRRAASAGANDDDDVGDLAGGAAGAQVGSHAHLDLLPRFDLSEVVRASGLGGAAPAWHSIDMSVDPDGPPVAPGRIATTRPDKFRAVAVAPRTSGTDIGDSLDHCGLPRVDAVVERRSDVLLRMRLVRRRGTTDAPRWVVMPVALVRQRLACQTPADWSFAGTGLADLVADGPAAMYAADGADLPATRQVMPPPRALSTRDALALRYIRYRARSPPGDRKADRAVDAAEVDLTVGVPVAPKPQLRAFLSDPVLRAAVDAVERVLRAQPIGTTQDLVRAAMRADKHLRRQGNNDKAGPVVNVGILLEVVRAGTVSYTRLPYLGLRGRYGFDPRDPRNRDVAALEQLVHVRLRTEERAFICDVLRQMSRETGTAAPQGKTAVARVDVPPGLVSNFLRRHRALDAADGVSAGQRQMYIRMLQSGRLTYVVRIGDVVVVDQYARLLGWPFTRTPLEQHKAAADATWSLVNGGAPAPLTAAGRSAARGMKFVALNGWFPATVISRLRAALVADFLSWVRDSIVARMSATMTQITDAAYVEGSAESLESQGARGASAASASLRRDDDDEAASMASWDDLPTYSDLEMQASGDDYDDTASAVAGDDSYDAGTRRQRDFDDESLL